MRRLQNVSLPHIDEERLGTKAATISLKTAVYSILAHRALLLKRADSRKGAKVFAKRVLKDVARRVGAGVTVELGLQFIAEQSSVGLAGEAFPVAVTNSLCIPSPSVGKTLQKL